MRASGNKITLIIAAVAIAALAVGIYDTIKLKDLEELGRLPCWKRMKLANNHFDSGKYKKAVEIYDRALEICDPSQHSLILRYKGYALFNLGTNNQTVRITPRFAAYANAEKLINYSCNYTLTKTSRDYFESAFKCFKKVSRNNPNDLDASLYAGILALYLSFPHTPDSVECFNKTLIIIDNLPSSQQEKNLVARIIRYCAWYGMGMAYRKIGQEEKSKKCFQKANETK